MSPLLNPRVRARSSFGPVSHHVIASVVFGAAAAFAPALAQAQSQGQTAPSVRLPSISVEGQKSAEEDYKVDRLQSPKYTEPLVDTPQTITVIPRQVM